MVSGSYGRTFGYDGAKVWFFDAEGIETLPDEFITREQILRERHGWREEREIQASIANVRAMLRETLKEHPRESITRLQVTPRLAVLLFLGGILTRSHLDRALYRREMYIEIPNVSLARGINLRVRVMSDPNLPYSYAFTDRRGAVLASS